jgi:hypothetical protein
MNMLDRFNFMRHEDSSLLRLLPLRLRAIRAQAAQEGLLGMELQDFLLRVPFS